MNPGCAPGRILCRHAEDQFPQFLADSRLDNLGQDQKVHSANAGNALSATNLARCSALLLSTRSISSSPCNLLALVCLLISLSDRPSAIRPMGNRKTNL